MRLDNRPMSRPWLLTLTGACALAAAGWWWATSGHRTPAVNQAVAVSSSGIAAPVAAGSAERSQPAASAARSSIRREFESAPDLFVYAQRVSTLARAGDADAQWMLSRVYDYCAAYASNPAAYASDTRAIAALDVATAPVMAAARERVSQRCVRFTPNDGLTSDVVQETRTRAALAGSLAAEASLLAEGVPMSEAAGYRRGLVDRVVASGDPQAYLAISRAMGLAASGSEMELGEVSGTWLSELAWQLAACRLGLDCRAQGALMTSYCANGGICSRDPAQDFPAFVRDGGVPRQGAEHLNHMVDSVLSRRSLLK